MKENKENTINSDLRFYGSSQEGHGASGRAADDLPSKVTAGKMAQFIDDLG